MIGGILLILAIIVAIIIFIIKINKYFRSDEKENKPYSTPNKLSAEELGAKGERIVSYILEQNLEGQQYLINNILFKDKYGESTQIDHIYINCYGIWVIETKNYTGKIYGYEKQKEWTHVIGNKQYKFYNPIMQNQSHINRLLTKIDYTENVKNLVVFLSGADISKIDSDHVCTTRNLRRRIEDKLMSKVLSTEQIHNYYKQITSLKEESNININEHIQKIKDNQSKIENNICPRCGGKLVLKQGEFGEFYGCENYPNCTFTKQI